MNKTIVALCLVLLLFLAACKQQTVKVKEEEKDIPPEKDAALDPIRDALAKLPAGTKILTEDGYRPLVPDSLKALDLYLYYKLYKYPDTRIDPFEADYILIHNSLQVDGICTPPGVWKKQLVVRSSAGRVVCLLKRITPLNESILAPLPEKNNDDMVSIKGGKLTYRTIDGQTTEDTLKDFRIDRYEVTTAQFARFLNEAKISPDAIDKLYSLKDPGAKIVFYDGHYRYLKDNEKTPVFFVSYFGAKAYCEHFGKRLPTNAQWYMAAGHADGRIYPWGNQTDFAKRANFHGKEDGYLVWCPVDAFDNGISPYGVYNLSGNMFEWTESGNLIGGCFELEPKNGRLDSMDQNEKIARNQHDGFRCVADR